MFYTKREGFEKNSLFFMSKNRCCMKKHKQLIQFIGSILILYLAWIIIEIIWLPPDNIVDFFLRESEAVLCGKALTIFGYETYFVHEDPTETVVLFMKDGSRLMGISDSCNGLVLFILFIGFVLSFPSNWIDKLKFIPFGIFFIYFLNVFRIICLTLIYIYFPQYLDFNHHYTFTLFVYFDIFLLWMTFVKRYGKHLITQESE